MIGQIAGAVPSALNIPNWDALIRNYGTAIGVEAKNMKTREEAEALAEEEAARLEAQQDAVVGKELVDGAQTLSQTETGGGSNALQQLLAQR
jgi:hypothetical protein